MIRVQSQYIGSIPYWAEIAKSPSYCIDLHAHFEKQSYRNRTIILGPNGLQSLVVPIFGRNKKQIMRDIGISYQESWQRIHLNSLQTAYRSAPYYEYIYPDLERIILQGHESLIDLNMDVHTFLVKRLKLASPLLSEAFDLSEGEVDRRNAFHPKKEKEPLAPYSQVFQEKLGFQSGAGIIDLVMNDLPGTKEYLIQLPAR